MAFFTDTMDAVGSSRNCDDASLEMELFGDEEGAPLPISHFATGLTWKAATAAATEPAAAASLLLIATEGPAAAYLRSAMGTAVCVGNVEVTMTKAVAEDVAAAPEEEAAAGAGVGAGETGGSSLAVASGKQEKKQEDKEQPEVSIVAQVYQVVPGCWDVIAVVMAGKIANEAANNVAHSLLSFFHSARVCMLDSIFASPAELRDASDSVRFLKTSAVTSEEVGSIAALPAPFLVGGFPAAVMTHCQVHSQKAAAFIVLWNKKLQKSLLHKYEEALAAVASWKDCAGATALAEAVGDKAARFAAIAAAVKEYQAKQRAEAVKYAGMYL